VCDPDGTCDVSLLDVLTSLIEKNLLRQRADADDEFWMLETIREFALEQLDPALAPELRTRHATTFFDAVADGHQGAAQAQWLLRIDFDYANVRAALEWLHDVNDPRALELLFALHNYWTKRGRLRDGHAWFGKTLRHFPDVEPRSQLRVLLTLATYQQLTGEYHEMHETAKCALDLAHQIDGDVEAWRATRLLARAKALNGSWPAARELLTAGLTAARAAEDQLEVARFARDLGMFSGSNGDYEISQALLEESLSIFRTLGDEFGTGLCLHDLGGLANERGHHAEALRFLRESAALNEAQGDRFLVTFVLLEIAAGLAATDEPETAAQLYGYCEERVEQMGFAREPGHLELQTRLETSLASSLSEADTKALRLGGSRLTDADALQLAGVAGRPSQA
jgi:tetratricopeptide (TPR) repeat protein